MSTGRKNLNLVSDFETTVSEDDCRVWGWGLTEIGGRSTVEFGQSITEFLVRVARVNAHVYFHNLKFDGRFILDFLLRNGFTHTTERNFGRGFFSTLISSMGEFYSITVRWLNGRKTEFRDSLKKLPMTVKRIGESFGGSLLKGELDYKQFRPVGHVLTDEEKLYIRNDILIVSNALFLQMSEGHTRLTVGSDSLQEFKDLMGKKLFERYFPILPVTMDADIRMAYRGGFTYVSKRFKKITQGRGKVFDVNSLYPFVMRTASLPYGAPEYFVGDPADCGRELFIVSITFVARLKPDHVPCIQIKGSMRHSETEYLEVIDEPVTLMVTSVDLALWRDHYDLDILSFNGGWKFKSVTGIFNKYIDKWAKVKSESKGGMRELAKLFLNSLYGKFATNPDITPKIPVLDKGVVRLVTGKVETRDPVYTAMGAFITAYARNLTIRAAQEHYCCFAYADTDSLHLIACHRGEPNLDIDPNRMGAWKLEYSFKMAMFWRAKQYTEWRTDTDRLETHIAGMPPNLQSEVTFMDYWPGRVFEGKLQQRAVPGGAILRETVFTMS